MRAVVVTEPGDAGVLQLRDVPTPEPRPGLMRVRVRAFGVNRADILQRRGMYPAPPGDPQDIPGLEFAGEVDAVGAETEQFKPGERVMGIVGGGGYAEFVLTPPGQAMAIPTHLSFEDAAAIPEVFVTAHDALERLSVRASEWVLVHAVGSGVGTAAVQLIRARSARCIGTSRTAGKLERAATLGMDAGIDTTDEDLVAAVRRVTGAGAHAAVDLVGGPLFPATLAAMATGGRVMVVGLTAGRRVEVDLGLILAQRLRVEGTTLRRRTAEEKAAAVASFTHSALPLFAAARMQPVVDRVFDVNEIADAHRYMESNATYGKIVVHVP